MGRLLQARVRHVRAAAKAARLPIGNVFRRELLLRAQRAGLRLGSRDQPRGREIHLCRADRGVCAISQRARGAAPELVQRGVRDAGAILAALRLHPKGRRSTEDRQNEELLVSPDGHVMRWGAGLAYATRPWRASRFCSRTVFTVWNVDRGVGLEATGLCSTFSKPLNQSVKKKFDKDTRCAVKYG